MIFASIDIGSNAVRLLFANAFERENRIHIEKASLIRIPIRLGKDVYKNNTISKKRATNLVKTLKAFKLLIDVYKPVSFVACATAATRDAVNGEELLKKVTKETGIKIKIIDGLQEAEIIRSSNDFTLPEGKNLTMYVDLGGGSTEISVLSKSKVLDARSFKIGTLRLLNKNFQKKEWNELETWLNQFKKDFGQINIVGSGGNINKIAKLYSHREDDILPFTDLEYAYKHLKSFTLHERVEQLGMRPDRADVIVPAARVFLFIAKIISADTIVVPKIGLADGLIIQLYKSYLEKGK